MSPQRKTQPTRDPNPDRETEAAIARRKLFAEQNEIGALAQFLRVLRGEPLPLDAVAAMNPLSRSRGAKFGPATRNQLTVMHDRDELSLDEFLAILRGQLSLQEVLRQRGAGR